MDDAEQLCPPPLSRLWETVGSIETAKEIKLFFWFENMLFHVLPRISLHTEKIEIGDTIDNDSISVVSRELRRCASSLRSVKLKLHDNVLSELLPVLSELPLLDEVDLDFRATADMEDQPLMIHDDSAQAMIRFLSNLPRTSISILNCNLLEPAHLLPFRVKAFRSFNCLMGDPVSFARAVTVPCMQKLEIQFVGYNNAESRTAFREELANRLELVHICMYWRSSISVFLFTLRS
jgi:hypothetical protein